MDMFPNSAVYKRVETNLVTLHGNIVTWAERPWNHVLIPCRSKRFYLLQNVQTISGAHPAFCAEGTVSSFPTVKTARA
jgi:hypothetical protein